jgi:hypothetical protein
VPDDADHALVAFRVNSEGAGPGHTDMNVYEIMLGEDGGPNRLSNPRFARQLEGWFASGAGRATTPPSDRGDGRMLRLRAAQEETLVIDTPDFAVTPGASYLLSVTAAIPVESADSGYITVIFLTDGSEVRRDILPLAPAPIELSSLTTNGAGGVRLEFPSLEGGRYLVELSHPGDIGHWPARLVHEVVLPH